MTAWLLIVHLHGPLVGLIAGTYATPLECVLAAQELPGALCIKSRAPVFGAICTPQLGASAVLPPCRDPRFLDWGVP